MKVQLVTWCMLFLLQIPAVAGHLVGGEIYYECLGNDTYAITLKMYRDCNGSGAPFDQSAKIAIYRSSDKSFMQVLSITHEAPITNVPFNQNIPCLVDTPNICIQSTFYTDTIVLDVPPGGIDLVHQRCCRPPNVINIANVADIGSTYYAHIPDPSLAPCNSSPRYNSLPPLALCAELYLEIDYSATDPDGDSLAYSFCRPYHGGDPPPGNPAPQVPEPPPFDFVPWATTFTDQYQITALPPLEVGVNSGIITGRPTQLGTYAFGVCVQEFRNGVFISENKRDFQLTTAYCEVDAAAAIDSALEECIGFDIQYFNISTLGDAWFWDFGDSTTTDDTSSYSNPIYTYSDTGTYTVTLVAYGEVCNDTTTYDYRVQHKIEPAFTPPDPECLDRHNYVFEPDGFYRETTEMRWEFWNDTAEISDDRRPKATKQYDDAGWHYITLHYVDPELGCVKEYTDSVEVYPNPDFHLVELYDEQCTPFEAAYSLQTYEANKPRFEWYIDSAFHSDSSTMHVFLEEKGLRSIQIRMITDSLCIDTVDLSYPEHILVLDTPVARMNVNRFEADMFTPEFVLKDSSIKAASWDFYLEDAYLGSDTLHALYLEDTGNYMITQVAAHESGCLDTTYLKIRVKPRYLTFIPNSFTPDFTGMNDEWKPSVYLWETYHLEIIDRWGKLVFESNDPHDGWNGKGIHDNKDCPIGVYIYKIVITAPDEEEPYTYDGKLHLLR